MGYTQQEIDALIQIYRKSLKALPMERLQFPKTVDDAVGMKAPDQIND